MRNKFMSFIVDVALTFAVFMFASCSFDNKPEEEVNTAEYFWYKVSFDPDGTGDKVIVFDAHVYNEEGEVILEEPDSTKSAEEMLNFLKQHKLPNRLDLAWYSYLEDKVYKVNAELPYESLLNTARNITDPKMLQLNLSVRLMPNGKINIESHNFSSCIRDEWNVIGVETSEYDDRLPKDKEPVFEGYFADMERDNYNLVRDSMKKDNSFLVDVSNFRQMRYDYDIEFDIKDYNFENITLRFQNGESVMVSSSRVFNTLIKNPSVPYGGNLVVSDRKEQYCYNINFDNEECWRVLEYAKMENVGGKGVMTIAFENDKVNVVVRYGSKEYPIRDVLSYGFSMSELRSGLQNMIE